MSKMINTNSTGSATVYADFNFGVPIPYATITPPYFKGINEKPKPIVFWTKKECEQTLNELPKDWLIHFLLKAQ